jgi:hypothetical protein
VRSKQRERLENNRLNEILEVSFVIKTKEEKKIIISKRTD